ncbi:hypothetical protein Bca52824_011655 [Brassica carinata]|uniref:Uncharacterized protein n=1 Tax=Brassica carinata TaxID=52824 RepID=A0A8X8B1H9_BRACI|nr:hypothetical protein Bca52824_011655 [Brassica carinata]
MTIVENASHSQIFSSNCLAISILVGIWKEIVRTAEIKSVEVSSTSLQLQLVGLIMDRITLLSRLCSDPCQVDSALVSEVQNLFNILNLLVGKHSEARLLVLDKVMFLLDYIVRLTDGLKKTDGSHELLLGVLNYKDIQQPRVPLRLTKMYCLLYTKLAYNTVRPRETKSLIPLREMKIW